MKHRRKIRGEMRTITLVAVLSVLSSAATADIIEWQDASGVRHYTNLKEEVPKESRDAAQVVVNEAARWPAGVAVGSPAAPQTASEEPRREAEVVYDRSQTSAYIEGWRAGIAANMPSENSGGSVQINGPLAVANALAPSPYPAYVAPYYYPFVTTSFDRGRSRHLTLRMLLQHQFALDRDGPFAYIDYRQPPSIALNPFLPRGLPHHAPSVTRVITR